jgi:hypothetical protein
MTLRPRLPATLAFLACWCAVSPAPARGDSWSVIFRGAATTSSLLYPHPNSQDPFERAQSYPIGSTLSAGAEVRYAFPGLHAAVGATVEYLHAALDRSITTAQGMDIPVSDGYVVVPVELTGYFIIPFSGPRFGVYIGGGGGAYFGHRLYSVALTNSSSDFLPPGYGIHVMVGLSFSPINHLSILGEMKFRDLQFKAINRFTRDTIVYNGLGIPVDRESDATIHTDGVMFQFAIAISF